MYGDVHVFMHNSYYAKIRYTKYALHMYASSSHHSRSQKRNKDYSVQQLLENEDIGLIVDVTVATYQQHH